MEARGKWTLFRSSDVLTCMRSTASNLRTGTFGTRWRKAIWGETMEAIDLWKLMLGTL